MTGVVIGVVVLIVIGFVVMKFGNVSVESADSKTAKFKNLEHRLWHSYVTFSIAKQNEIYALFLDEESREIVLETKELPEQLVEAIHLFHEELSEELKAIQALLLEVSDADRPIIEAYISYLEARNIFLNKEWSYTRAILRQDEDAITATRLYRQARNLQTAKYETFANLMMARAKKLKVDTAFKTS